MTDDTTPPVEGPKELATIKRGPLLIEKSALWARRLAWFAVISLPIYFALAGLGARWGLWSWRTGLGKLTSEIGPKLLGLGLVIGVICLILTLISRNKRKGLLVSALAIIVPLGSMAYGKNMRATVGKLPAIHDITTDTQDVPIFTKTLLDLRAQTENVNPVNYIGKKGGRENELYSVQQTRAYPDVRPLIMSGEPEQVFGQALTIAKQSGWKIHTKDAAGGIIEATATTFWYGFKDDVIIRIRAGEGGGSVVDVRSISRVGGSDVGANAARIRKFIKALN